MGGNKEQTLGIEAHVTSQLHSDALASSAAVSSQFIEFAGAGPMGHTVTPMSSAGPV